MTKTSDRSEVLLPASCCRRRCCTRSASRGSAPDLGRPHSTDWRRSSVERRAERERIPSPAADMTVGEPAVVGLRRRWRRRWRRRRAPSWQRRHPAPASVSVFVAAAGSAATKRSGRGAFSRRRRRSGGSGAGVRDDVDGFAGGECSVDLPAMGPAAMPGLMAPAEHDGVHVDVPAGRCERLSGDSRHVHPEWCCNIECNGPLLTADGPSQIRTIGRFSSPIRQQSGLALPRFLPVDDHLRHAHGHVSNRSEPAGRQYPPHEAAVEDGDVWSTFGGSPWNSTAASRPTTRGGSTADHRQQRRRKHPINHRDHPPLQARSAVPGGELGWVFLVSVADSLAFDSSEGHGCEPTEADRHLRRSAAQLTSKRIRVKTTTSARQIPASRTRSLRVPAVTCP